MHTVCICICVLLLLFIGKLQGNEECYPLLVHWLYFLRSEYDFETTLIIQQSGVSRCEGFEFGQT